MTSPALADLAKNNPCAFALIGAMARRHPRARTMSVDFANEMLLAEGEAFPNGQINDCLRQMEKHNLGIFRWSTNLNDYVFAWSFMPVQAFQMLREGVCVAAQTSPYSTVKDDADDIDAIDPIPVHTFRLRPNCIVHLELPDNLNRNDVRKLHLILKALSMKTPAAGAGWQLAHPLVESESDDDTSMDDDDEFSEIRNGTDSEDKEPDDSEV